MFTINKINRRQIGNRLMELKINRSSKEINH